MQKVKIFSRFMANTEDLQEEINKFIEQENINVVNISIDASSIFVLYEPKPIIGV